VTRSCSRAAYRRIHSQEWTDAIRALHPNDPMYTFWDYKRKRWERDDGLRLDHILVSSALMARLQDPASIATSADWRAPAIMRPYG
jgi:exodeoxyribonuclease III